MPPATSVFVGGGTPTLVPPEGLAAVLRAIPLARRRRGHGRVQPRRRHARRCSRRTSAPASTGCRSACSRWCPTCSPRSAARHDPANVERAVAAARAVGLPTFNVDLIYGSVGESLADWRVTLERALALEPPHVSAYALTVEAGTPLADDPARHPDDDVQADEYELADDLLTAAGLANYEVSNWARPGHECRHNLLYWRQHDYRGLRLRRPLAPRRAAVVEPAHAGALHRRRRRRAARPRRPASRSTPRPARFEGLQLSLRTTAGVPARRPRRRRAARRRRAGRRPLGAHPPRPADGQRGRRPAALSVASRSRPDRRQARRQWPASVGGTVQRGVREVGGEPVAERRRRRAVERRRTRGGTGHTTSVELDVGRRDLQGDVVGQAVEALDDGVDDADRHRVEGAGHRLDLGRGGSRRRPPARTRGPARGRTGTARRAGRAARRPRRVTSRRRGRRRRGGRRTASSRMPGSS